MSGHQSQWESVARLDGLLDAGAREATALCGPLHTDAHTGTEDGVEKLTNNTAELMAIVQALRHAVRARTCAGGRHSSGTTASTPH